MIEFRDFQKVTFGGDSLGTRHALMGVLVRTHGCNVVQELVTGLVYNGGDVKDFVRDIRNFADYVESRYEALVGTEDPSKPPPALTWESQPEPATPKRGRPKKRG